MAGKTKIEWTERTWNPVTGCDRVSPGCDHCYALTWARSLKAMGSKRYQADGDPRTSGPGFGLTLHWDLVNQPRHWKPPSVVFVNSMSDLFHDRVPLDFIQAVFRTMEETPQHTYQVLTKRSARLVRLANRLPWPPNVWMGVSVENEDYLIRAARLARVPAAVRFLSVEPMLGPVDLGGILSYGWCPRFGFNWHECDRCPDDHWRIGWIIAGGESGPGARPCDLDWLRDLRDQCRATGAAFFLKQLGAVAGRQAGCRDAKGAHLEAWPFDLRIREMPQLRREGAR